MTAKLSFTHPYSSGAPTTTITIVGEVKIEGTKPSPHDLAGIFFAAEFAVNNDASKHLGKPLRAHFFLEE